MKSMFVLVCSICLLFLAACGTQSKSLEARQPRWVPVKGYWVVEDNIRKKGASIVYFYNRNSELVYQETVAGYVDLDRTRTLLRLNRVLEEAVANWDRQAPVALESGLLARQMAH